MSNNETANATSDPLSDEAATARTVALMTLAHHVARFVADAKVLVGVALDAYGKYAEFQTAVRAKAKELNDAEDLAAAGK